MKLCDICHRAVLPVLMALCLWAGGCVRTAHPILKDEQVMSNDALLGKWVGDNGKVSAELRPGQDNKYQLSYTNEDGKTGSFLIRFGKMGDLTVAELSADAFSDKTANEFKAMLLPLYAMVVVDKIQPQLILRSPSVDWLKKYVEAHPDELDVNNSDDLIIQSSTDDFQKFFLKHYKDNGMLGDPTVFVRPGDPTTRPTN